MGLAGWALGRLDWVQLEPYSFVLNWQRQEDKRIVRGESFQKESLYRHVTLLVAGG